MENNLNMPINIEFYGLPGSGKSTISHLLASNLRELGYKVYEPSYRIDNNIKFVRLIIKFYYFVILFIFKHQKYVDLRQILIDNNYRKLDFFRQILNISYKYVYYDKKSNGCNYVNIWDEGIVQSSISIGINNSQDFNYTFDSILKLVNQDIVGIYIKVYKNVAVSRMNKRKKNDSRFEKNNQKDAFDLLNKFEFCCNSVNLSRNKIFKNNSDNYDQILKDITRFIGAD